MTMLWVASVWIGPWSYQVVQLLAATVVDEVVGRALVDVAAEAMLGVDELVDVDAEVVAEVDTVFGAVVYVAIAVSIAVRISVDVKTAVSSPCWMYIIWLSRSKVAITFFRKGCPRVYVPPPY
jgi:hypothetical protein